MIAAVTNNRISATVSGGNVAASISAASITASSSGGIGPAGASGGSLSQISDVLITGISDGDVIRYSAASQKWLNTNEKNLLTDGGNF